MLLSFHRMQIVLLLALSNIFLTLQSPATQNYTRQILRISKAAQIKAYLNEDQDRCSNFYEFACGKWHRFYPPTKNIQKTAYLDQLKDLYMRKSIEMLKGDQRTDSIPDTMLKEFFESCYNNYNQEKENELLLSDVEPIIQVVNFHGGWPKITSKTWYESEYDWLKVIAEIRRKLGIDILIGLDIVPDFEDKDMQRIKVGAPKLTLGSKDAYLSDDYDDLRDEYKDNIAYKLHTYFEHMPDKWAKEVAAQVLNVEQQLARGLPDNSRLTLEQTTRQRYATELKQAYGNYVDLSRYLNLIFNSTIYVQVYETPEDYMSNLVDVIKQTPKLTIANYTMWRVLESFDIAGEINSKHNDISCIHKVMEYFPYHLENMFNRNYNNMHIINELQSLWADIKQIFRDELQTPTKIAWVSAETRQKALQKLDSIDLQIVATHQEVKIDSLVLRKEKYFQNLIKILEWQTAHKLAKLIEKPQNNDVEHKLPKYELGTNKISIPITFLQSRFFFDAEYPSALKYSTLGVLLAQEMLHGFDLQGQKYDNHGNQRNWWDSVSEYGYDQRAKCFERQYDDLKLPNSNDKLKEKFVLANIAENGGLSIAYRAYQKWWDNVAHANLIERERLPLIKYTQDELFFIAYAQLSCAAYYEKDKNKPAFTEQRRINGVLSNSKEFAHEFKCRKNSLLNPDKKCIIY